MAGEGGPAGAFGGAGAARGGHAPVPMPPKLRLTEEQIGLLRREGDVRRVAAVGEGSIAVRFVSEHLGRRAGFAAPTPPGQ